MRTRRVTGALSAAALAAVSLAQPTAAKDVEISGSATYIPTVIERVEREDGSILERSHLRTVVLCDDPGVPLHNSPQDCMGTTLVLADGTMMARGYCDGVDLDGDVWWIWWQNLPDANTWGFMGGTGKYENVSGNGTTEPTMLPNGRMSVRWQGTLTVQEGWVHRAQN